MFSLVNLIMRNQYIFDIPIYRKTKDDFDAEIETHVTKRIKEIISCDPEERPLDHQVIQRLHQSIIADFGGTWQFNQIVGWLRLYVEGNNVGCHLWWVDKRINRRMRNKRLYLQSPSDILHARFTKESSRKIYEKLLLRLIELSEGTTYKNRYLDLDVFQRIGPLIDWRKLLYSHANQE